MHICIPAGLRQLILATIYPGDLFFNTTSRMKISFEFAILYVFPISRNTTCLFVTITLSHN